MLPFIGVLVPIASVFLAQFLSKWFELQKRRKAIYEGLILLLGSGRLTKAMVQTLTEAQICFSSSKKVQALVNDVFSAYHNPLLSYEERQDKLIQLIEAVALKIGQRVNWYQIKHDFTLHSRTKMDV